MCGPAWRGPCSTGPGWRGTVTAPRSTPGKHPPATDRRGPERDERETTMSRVPETEMVRQIDRNAEPPRPDGGRGPRRPVDTSVVLGGVRLRNPVVTASGCFASGREMSELIDLRQLGAVTVKSMTLEPWQGK